jgi:hypothetical protein
MTFALDDDSEPVQWVEDPGSDNFSIVVPSVKTSGAWRQFTILYENGKYSLFENGKEVLK